MLSVAGALACLSTAALLASSVPHPGRSAPPLRRAAVAHALLADPAAAISEGSSALLGEVLSIDAAGLITIKPQDRELARVGALLSFDGGGVGVIVSERCGLYFASTVEGAIPQASEPATLLPGNLTVAVDDDAPWGGLHDHFGVAAAAASAVGPNVRQVSVFGEPVGQARRRPIGSPLHTGVVAIEALAPIGRGQSMMVFGPDSLPAGSGRTDLALRIISAQHELQTDVKCVLVLGGTDGERASSISKLRASGALESVKVLEATTPLQAMIAASAACSIAEACGDADVLVVVDSLRPHLTLWRSICSTLQANNVVVTPEEEGSQQRAYYSRLVERAARRKDGGSVSLVLLQPSVSVLPADAEMREAYTLADFVEAKFTKTVCARVELLESKGIKLTREVLTKVGIPLPGSDHPAAGKGQRSAQHLEELTSLVDGHIDLRESLASRGRVPPIDPANSLTRIGVGSSKLRPLATSPAMAAVCGPLRLELASAADYVHCEEAQARRAAAYMAALQQPNPQPLTLGEQVALLQAASSGALDGPVAEAGEAGTPALLEGLLGRLRDEEADLLRRISQSGLLGESATERLAELTAEHLAGIDPS